MRDRCQICRSSTFSANSILVTSYSLPATADSVGFPYQSDCFSERQNFFETPSTRTKTSSFEGGVECPESRVEGNEEEIEFIFRA